jgi:hypothetical protein
MTDSVGLGEVGISESKGKQIGTLMNKDMHGRTKAYFCWNGPWRARVGLCVALSEGYDLNHVGVRTFLSRP